MLLPPLEISFLKVKICGADLQEHVATNTDTTQGDLQPEGQKSRRGRPGRGCVSLCDHGALAAVPGTAGSGHPSAHHSADSSWPGKLRAKQQRAKKIERVKKNREFLQWMPHRKNSTIRQTPVRQEQLWLVPWDARSFTTCIWQFSCFCCCWVVLVGNSLLRHVGYVQLFCNPLAIKSTVAPLCKEVARLVQNTTLHLPAISVFRIVCFLTQTNIPDYTGLHLQLCM